MVLNLSKLQSDSLPLLMLWVAYKGAFKNGMFTKFARTMQAQCHFY